MTSVLSVPQPLHQFFSLFPLYTYPRIPSSASQRPVVTPTLWIHPPRNTDPSTSSLLSTDVECLKWQAYIALRGLKNIKLRWDVSQDGSIDGRLPNLHIPSIKPAEDGDKEGGELLPAHLIREWVDEQHGVSEVGELEGYIDENAKDESRAWVKLLEGNVHAALALSEPPQFSFLSLLTTSPSAFTSGTTEAQTLLTPPPPPLTGLSSLIPQYGGPHIDKSTVELQYREAIASVSERLGTDKWFLGSTSPTALDALLYAYLHSLLKTKDNTLRFEVTRRVNLVSWEKRVGEEVKSAFQKA
ncbi:hypothetical protein C8Q75DRAFT_7272 [Abortiporus biennis]|nr:hypothetical protein C8Q75DRAFT_7272 [Abortiporus biennis]